MYHFAQTNNVLSYLHLWLVLRTFLSVLAYPTIFSKIYLNPLETTLFCLGYVRILVKQPAFSIGCGYYSSLYQLVTEFLYLIYVYPCIYHVLPHEKGRLSSSSGTFIKPSSAFSVGSSAFVGADAFLLSPNSMFSTITSVVYTVLPSLS